MGNDELERFVSRGEPGWMILEVICSGNLTCAEIPKGKFVVDYGGEDNYGPLDDFEWRYRIIL